MTLFRRTLVSLVTISFLLLFLLCVRDLVRGIRGLSSWIECFLSLLFVTSAGVGLLLDFRNHRKAAVLNVSTPVCAAVLFVPLPAMLGESEGVRFLMIFMLIPIFVAALIGTLYYVERAVDS